jgi:hypothetical protein
MFSKFSIVKSKINLLIDNKTDSIIKSESLKSEDIFFEEYLSYIIFISSGGILFAIEIITSYMLPSYYRSHYFTGFILIYSLYFTAEFYSITAFSKKQFFSQILSKINFNNDFMYKVAKNSFRKARVRQIKNMTRIYSRTKGDRIIKWSYAISSVIIIYLCFKFFSVQINSKDLISVELNYLISNMLLIFAIVYFALTIHKTIAQILFYSKDMIPATDSNKSN